MEFVCSDREALVRGANVRATLDAFALQPEFALRLLEPFGLKPDEMKEDSYLPVQKWLDAMKHLAEQVGPYVLRSTGTAVVQNAEFPPHFDSVESVLMALDQIYYLNHRGEVGHYHPERNADGSVTVRCETPYPRQFERGLVEGIARNERLCRGARYQVRYIDGEPGSSVTCTLVAHKL